MAHNNIYEKLTADPNDLVGALAYIIYKQQKVEFCKNTSAGNPSRAEIEQFHAIASMDTSIAAYRSQAEALAQAFLNAGLDDLVQRTEDDTRQGVLYNHVLNLNSGLQTQLSTISQALAGKRTWLGWLRDVGGNLVVNVVTILVVGAVVLGYNALSKVQQHTEKNVGLSTSEGNSAASTSAEAAKR
ncbi:hypothetical protein GTP23_22045 [Pseudoduganella sp. FT93W]|uniref:Uncharacterized protein n=1 Tax=Duganella fentianensis TaxID=2692177 RepID=A0A845I329_9BURK|nr:hypothetical protein [Duganella fentianensis]MYN47723.1 hypothetical protein [Duganella fentianensis]